MASLPRHVRPGSSPGRLVLPPAIDANERRVQNSFWRRGSLYPGGLERNVHNAYYHRFVTTSIDIYLVCIRMPVPFWETGAEKSGPTQQFRKNDSQNLLGQDPHVGHSASAWAFKPVPSATPFATLLGSRAYCLSNCIGFLRCRATTQCFHWASTNPIGSSNIINMKSQPNSGSKSGSEPLERLMYLSKPPYAKK